MLREVVMNIRWSRWSSGAAIAAKSSYLIVREIITLLKPIGSMYAIYGNIYHQYTPNVSIYIPYMGPMGNDQKKT